MPRNVRLLPLFLLLATALPLAGQSVPPAQTSAPLTITLQDAITRARANSPEFHAALTEMGVAQQEKVQARSALLPSVNYDFEYLYTQPVAGHTADNAPRFIANNAVHEYISLGNAHQELSLAELASYRRSVAMHEAARARAEVARRGLVATVVQTYYGLVVAQRHYATAQEGASEAESFLKISRQLEHGGEVAHSDAIKAELQYNDKMRDLREAQLGMERARVQLALLLFPDFNQNFTVIDDMGLPESVPPLEEVTEQARRNNPDLAAALSALRAENFEVDAARAGYLPEIGLDYYYGVDSTRLATHIDGLRNLGYSASATLKLPVWNWGATHSQVKQSTLRRDQARLELSYAQRKLLGQLQTLYGEAQASYAELELLRRSAELAAESLRLTTLRYQGGEATVLEVVDAQNSLIQAKDAFDQGEARCRTALANLQTLTGTL